MYPTDGARWSGRKYISTSNLKMSLKSLFFTESYYFQVYAVSCDVHFRYSDDVFMWTAYGAQLSCDTNFQRIHTATDGRTPKDNHVTLNLYIDGN